MAAVRRLGPADAAVFQSLRLAGLEEAPAAFGASLDDERDLTLAEVADRLVRSRVFGAFDGDDLAGVAAWHRLAGARVQHRGALWGMYVRPDARHAGVGSALLAAVIADARPEVEQVHLKWIQHCLTRDDDLTRLLLNGQRTNKRRHL